jgi:2-polyprenyl-6-methoxyphenol hydroxylase-like FAD-dependent oxidoreductase
MAAAERGSPPVVIVGAGPAGLVAAVTLAGNGVGSLLVERNPGLSPLPRATAVSTRTMELLRSFGLEGGPGRAARPFGTELVALDQGPDRVTVTLPERATGRQRTARAAYLAGADGAHSAVRRLLGIAMTVPTTWTSS